MEPKNIRKRLYAKLNVLLGSVLTMLGFNGCGENPFNSVCLYGTPYANFDVKGAVLNEDGDKLEGMKVTTKEVYQEQNTVVWANVLQQSSTDARGRYQHQGRWYPHGVDDSQVLRVVVEDPKGAYAADSVDVELTHTKEGKGDWCDGTDVSTADFRLKRIDK